MVDGSTMPSDDGVTPADGDVSGGDCAAAGTQSPTVHADGGATGETAGEEVRPPMRLIGGGQSPTDVDVLPPVK